MCNGLEIAKEGVVYDDWFLPNINELKQMHYDLNRNNLGGFSGDKYWSSSLSDGDLAMYLDFANGYFGHGFRCNGYRVRSARVF